MIDTIETQLVKADRLASWALKRMDGGDDDDEDGEVSQQGKL